MSLRDYQLTRLDHLRAEQQPVEPRRCLSCDNWLRSTGPDHRICNVCKGEHYHQLQGREGSRL
jgi:Zn finger protein HypA/HybF involved in hydrogenase expression